MPVNNTVPVQWLDVRAPESNKLLFRYDPQRDLVQIQIRGVRHVVDLAEIRNTAPESAKGNANERR
jgi:hypothetical protein